MISAHTIQTLKDRMGLEGFEPPRNELKARCAAITPQPQEGGVGRLLGLSIVIRESLQWSQDEAVAEQLRMKESGRSESN